MEKNVLQMFFFQWYEMFLWNIKSSANIMSNSQKILCHMCNIKSLNCFAQNLHELLS
jgi:hypothetical protein